MYCGITQGLVPVVDVSRQPTLLSYVVALPEPLLSELAVGASVAVDGVCQSVVRIEQHHVYFDVIEETLRLTNLSDLKEGALVSVERSLKVGDEIGGHEMAGHVIGTGRVLEVESHEHRCRLRISVPEEWMKFILPKGFVAVDGSSLTVGAVGSDFFDIHLIPETLRLTNLGKKGVGADLNIELDARTVAIVHTVERVLNK